MKICALLVPREMKLEHSGGIKAMTDEQIEWSIEFIEEMIAKRDALAMTDGQIERSIEFIEEMIAKRDAAANAKEIEGEAEIVQSLPAPGSGGTKMPKAKVSLSKSP